LTQFKKLSLYLNGKGGGGQAILAQAGGLESEKLKNVQEK